MAGSEVNIVINTLLQGLRGDKRKRGANSPLGNLRVEKNTFVRKLQALLGFALVTCKGARQLAVYINFLNGISLSPLYKEVSRRNSH